MRRATGEEDARPIAATQRAERKEARREQLVKSAASVFMQQGVAAASVDDIVRAAGVAKGTFYLYFRGKKEIFDELVIDLNHRVRQAMTEGAAQGSTRVEKEQLGFAAFFRDPVVAAVGGLGMLPIAARAVRGLRWPGR